MPPVHVADEGIVPQPAQALGNLGAQIALGGLPLFLKFGLDEAQ
jgi:hypothetical protein